MFLSIRLVLIALFISLVSLSGCGGGGGGGGSTVTPPPAGGPFAGNWGGTLNPTNGQQYLFRLGLTQTTTSSAISGMAKLSAGVNDYYGSITGDSTTFSATVNGVNYVFTVTTNSATAFSGTFTGTGPGGNGTFSVTKQTIHTLSTAGNFSGNLLPTVGSPTTFTAAFSQSGGTVSGTATIGAASSLPISDGKIFGDLVQFKVMNGGVVTQFYGTLDQNANPDVLNGTYSNTNSSGSFGLQKTSTENDQVAGSWSGYYEPSGGQIDAFAFDISQSGANINVSANTGYQGSGTGTVTGNTVTFTLNLAGGGVVNFVGTHDNPSDSISGTYSGTVSGNFTVFR